MRMLLWARLDTEQANKAIPDGTLQKNIQGIIEKLQPEACYFTPTEGKRSAFLIFDMQDPAEMPALTEGFFQLGAKVTLQPVMNLDDLSKGLGRLAA